MNFAIRWLGILLNRCIRRTIRIILKQTGSRRIMFAGLGAAFFVRLRLGAAAHKDEERVNMFR